MFRGEASLLGCESAVAAAAVVATSLAYGAIRYDARQASPGTKIAAEGLREEQLPGTRFVCVNLSGISLNDEGFIDTVLQTLTDYPDVAPLLCLEITEAVALRDLPVSRRFMERLRERGVRVAHTSFNYLRELEATVLKIDGSLVRDPTAHPRNAAIVSAIVALVRNMGMRTIAEWAEDAAAIEALAGCGADYVQGWAIGAAQKPKAILQARSSADFVQDASAREALRHLVPPGSS